MAIGKKVRATVIVLFGVALALAAGLQTAATVATRTQPQLTLQLDPNNGRALGNQAFVLFTQRVQEGADILDAAKAVEVQALKAYELEPLNPQALAILAIAQDDTTKKRAILEEALKLNRRSLTLQGLALERDIANEDFPAIVSTLDQILRVHPERRDEFFPVLAQALGRADSVPSFVEILANQSPWQDRFLSYASGVETSSINAAQLKRQVVSDDPNLDVKLISNLVRFGELAAAQEHYAYANKAMAQNSSAKWPSALAPFDWTFADSRDMRAQLSRDGSEIEIFVKSGSGGIVMQRIIQAPSGPSRVFIKFDVQPQGLAKDVRIQMVCAADKTILLTSPLTEQANGFAITDAPAECGFVNIAIYARAWRGRPSLRGTIQSIEIKSQTPQSVRSAAPSG